MELKELIIKFLKEKTSTIRTLDGEELSIMLYDYEQDVEYLANEITKLCVSQQCIWLESFIDWHNYKSSYHKQIYKSDMTDFIEDYMSM